jgi:hypothetical protein
MKHLYLQKGAMRQLLVISAFPTSGPASGGTVESHPQRGSILAFLLLIAFVLVSTQEHSK